MWTPDRDAELRRLGVETYISRHPGADVHEVLDRYLLLLDPEGRAALLRERNRGIEEGRWTQPIMAKAKTPLPDPWPPEAVDRLRELCDRRLANADIAQIMGKTEKSVAGKRRRLGLRPPAPVIIPAPAVHKVRHSRWTDEDIATLTKLHEEGFTDKQIGAVLGRPPKGVESVRDKLGLRSRAVRR